jgi:hypothetical protein
LEYEFAIQVSKPFPEVRPSESLSIRNVGTGHIFGYRTQDDKAVFFGKGDLSGAAYNLSDDLFLRVVMNDNYNARPTTTRIPDQI